MSVIGKTFKLDIDFRQLQQVVDRILQDLVPLTHARNLIDETTTEELSKHVSAVVQAAERNMLALGHLSLGFGHFFLCLKGWDNLKPKERLMSFNDACIQLLIAHGDTSDAHRVYKETAEGLQLLFNGSVENHGKDTILTVESTTTDKDNSVIHSTLEQINSSLQRNLSNAQDLTDSVAAWLLEFNQMIQSYLQDENASLDIPLDQLPFVPENWDGSFGKLATIISRGQDDQNKILVKYSSLFTLTPSNVSDCCQQERRQRIPLTNLPPHKLAVPEARGPTPQATPFPSRIVLNALQGGGEFSIDLISTDQTTAGQSVVRGLFDIKPRGAGCYHTITIRCGFKSMGPETLTPERFQIVDRRPKTEKHIAEDSGGKPGDWKPTVKTVLVKPDLLEIWNGAFPGHLFPESTFLPLRPSTSLSISDMKSTFRYPGFCSFMQSFRSLGLLNQYDKIHVQDWNTFVKLLFAHSVVDHSIGVAQLHDALVLLVPRFKLSRIRNLCLQPPLPEGNCTLLHLVGGLHPDPSLCPSEDQHTALPHRAAHGATHHILTPGLWKQTIGPAIVHLLKDEIYGVHVSSMVLVQLSLTNPGDEPVMEKHIVIWVSVFPSTTPEESCRNANAPILATLANHNVQDAALHWIEGAPERFVAGPAMMEVVDETDPTAYIRRAAFTNKHARRIKEDELKNLKEEIVMLDEYLKLMKSSRDEIDNRAIGWLDYAPRIQNNVDN
ncbi:hypothetical protein CVT24_002637 [Panaeolus cyanescens]|uniref:Uncharacterized protein n=1 Tax=Panaeolus cyanescens TaxID=181874 RepID=A0A409YU65_9AGAR|nr:hypothetical protein CVT24_002637 [Panaeolus cyanescens]